MATAYFSGGVLVAVRASADLFPAPGDGEYDRAFTVPQDSDLWRDLIDNRTCYRADEGVLEVRGEDAIDPETGETTESWNAVEIPAEVVPVPETVTATQAKLTLLGAGLYEAIETYVEGAETEPDGVRYRIVWNAANWSRSSPELNRIAAEIGLTPEQIDDLFRQAATF